MTAEGWLTLAIVGATVVVMARDLLPPGAALFGGMVAVLGVGVVTPDEAFVGFSNPAPLTIAALYVLARAVDRTGALSPIVHKLLGDGSSTRRSLTRLLIPTAATSGVVNNTPIVAMLVPQLERWALRHGRSPSTYMMPLSFAAMLGGLLTVVGTSTTIVVSGLLEESGREGLSFFEISRVGVPIAVFGILLIVLLTPILLPVRRSARDQADTLGRKFVVEMTVEHGGPLEGTTIQEAALRGLAGVFLAAIHRGDTDLTPVGPDTHLEGGDVLRFVGRVDNIADLQAIPGITSAAVRGLEPLTTRSPGYFEAVVGESSRHVGRTLREIGFRGRYQAVVIGIHRSGAPVNDKLGQVRLRVGDTLFLLSDAGFKKRWSDRNDFLLISEAGEAPEAVRRRMSGIALIGTAVIVAVATNLLPLVTAALIGAVSVVAFKILTPGEARDAVDIDVVLAIASAFGLAAAMTQSGLASTLADGLVEASRWAGDRGVLVGVMIATIVVSSVITNNAAALLIFPIAIDAASATGLDPRGIAIAVAVAATTSFMTPIGYQTNTMVYGPGGYRFSDYARLGAPLTALTLIVSAALIPMMWG